MKLDNHAFSDPKRVNDLSNFLMQQLNIPSGRELLLLLGDLESTNNAQAIHRWTRSHVWESLSENKIINMSEIRNKLLRDLEEALTEYV